jgi:hypothetical protein
VVHGLRGEEDKNALFDHGLFRGIAGVGARPGAGAAHDPVVANAFRAELDKIRAQN